MQHLFSVDGERALASVIALRPLLAFDFDGTLAAIVEHPDDARISVALANSLERLGRVFPLAIVSGRRVDDIRGRLSFQPRYIVGSHGAEDPLAPQATPPSLLDPMRDRLAAHADDLARDGVWVEDKGRSIALHYRLAPDPARAGELVDRLARALPPGVSSFGGKLVMNFVAAGAPDKAEAVARLLEHSGATAAVFLGDDVNDEPVFVYKLIAKGTLEEKIQLLQQKKSELAHSILSEGESQKMALTQEDLQAIFAPLTE